MLRYSKELASVTQVQSRLSIIREGSLKFITPEISEGGERESSYIHVPGFLKSYRLQWGTHIPLSHTAVLLRLSFDSWVSLSSVPSKINWLVTLQVSRTPKRLKVTTYIGTII